MEGKMEANSLHVTYMCLYISRDACMCVRLWMKIFACMSLLQVYIYVQATTRDNEMAISASGTGWAFAFV